EEGSNIGKVKMQDLLIRIKAEDSEAYEHYDEMEFQFNQNEWGRCLMNAVMVMATVYTNCEKQFSKLKEYAWMADNNFNRPGYASELFEEIVEESFDSSIEDFIRKMLLRAINQHTFSSYRKSKIGQGIVHNYMIE